MPLVYLLAALPLPFQSAFYKNPLTPNPCSYKKKRRMQTYLLSLGKAYFRSYQGLSPACWMGIFVSLIESTLAGTFYFLSVYFVNELRFSVTQAGVIISCYGLGAIIGGVVSGKLSDRFSAAIVSAGSLFIQGIIYLAFTQLTSLLFLSINIFLLGAATYGFITSNHVWVLSLCGHREEQKLKALNLLSTASNLGLGVSALLISVFSSYGFQHLFLIIGILFLSLSCWLLSVDKTSSFVKPLPSNSSPASSSPHQWLIVLTLMCVFFIGAIVSQLSSTYAIYVQSAFPSLGMNAISLLFAVNSFLVVFFATPLGDYFGQYNKVLMTGIGGFCIGFGMLMLTFSYTFSLAILACVIYTLGEIIFFCVVQFICYQKGADNKKGESLGLYRMVYAASRVVGPTTGGAIYNHFGGNMVWYVSGVLGCLCLLFCFKFQRLD